MRKKKQIGVLPIVEGEGSRLTLALPRSEGAQLAYSLGGSLECEVAPGRLDCEDTVTIARAYGVARLTGSEASEGIPRQLEFHLARPVRAKTSGKAFFADFDLIYPELLGLKQYRSVAGPGHPFAVRPVRVRLRLSAMWERGFSGLAICGSGRILIPTISERPLLAACVFFCLRPPKKPKCKSMCLSVKVGPKAGGGAILDKSEVQKIIKRVNEIWGCTAPGQCCIEFTLKDDDITLTPAGLPAAVKVRTGQVHPEHQAAVQVSRSTTCFNLYYVERMVPAPAAPGIGSYPGMTLKGADSSTMVQYPPGAGYTNETLATVTAHELGHALGLAWDDGTDDKGVEKHSKNSTNLMHNIANLGTKLNAEQCAKARESPLLHDTDHECESKPTEV